jgi:hypothetical protein
VLSLGPLKRLVLRAQVISPEPQPQPPSTGPVPPQAEEEPSVVAETRALGMPPPPAPATAVEEGEAVTKATVTQAALEASSEAGPSIEGVVMVLDEDSVPSPPSESHDATMARRWSRPRYRRRRAFSLLWRCQCPLQQWKFKVLSRPRRWQSPLRPEFPSRSRR